MLEIDESSLEGSFSTDTSDLFKDHLYWVDLDNLDGELWNNRILVEIQTIMYDKIRAKTGFELWADNTYDIGTFAIRSGKIAKLPKELVFWDEDRQNGIPWRTTIEAEVGDDVWFYGMSAHSGEKVKCNEKLYVFLNYADLYVCKKQNGVVICLNGNVLLKPILKNRGFMAYKEEYIDPDYAIVAYIGSINTEYEAEYRADDKNLKVGQTVSISGIIPRRLEIKPFLNFDGSEYIVCQNYEIQGFLDE